MFRTGLTLPNIQTVKKGHQSCFFIPSINTVHLISLLLIRDVTLNPGVVLKLISNLLNIHHMTNYMINCFTFKL